MSKNPAFQFYPGDWTRDLDDYDLEVEGAWIRILCRLWWSENRGILTKTLKEWAKILRKTEKKTKKILQFLLEKHISDGHNLDNQNITIISRRMINDERIRQIRQQVGKLGGNPVLMKQSENLVNQNSTKASTKKGGLHLHSSSSSSSSNKKKEIYTEDFLTFWNTYPLKKARPTAFKAWNKKKPDLQTILKAINTQSKEKERLISENKFCAEWPYPSTWLNQERWEDEPIEIEKSDDPYKNWKRF